MTLNEVLKSVERAYGAESVQEGVELKDIDRLPLPARALNKVLYGGLPYGRLIEFSGAEHSGKTTTALLTIAAHQRLRPDVPCIFVDAEGTYDSVWASKLGVDNQKLIKITPENMTAEECLQMVVDLASSGEVGVIVLDSIPALVPQQEDAKTISEYTMAGVSRPLTVFSRKVQRELIKFPNTVFIAINQLRDNVGGYGSPTKTIGGRMWRHSCSVRVEFRGANIDAEGRVLTQSAENVAGAQIQMYLIKNKTAPRDRKVGSYKVHFHSGFDEKQDVISAALEEEFVQKAGPSVRYVNEDGEVVYNARGMAAFVENMPDEVYKDIVRRIDGNV